MGEKPPQPGDGLRSIKTTSVFKIINYELYSRPNKVIMVLGSVALAGCFGYIAWMRYQWEKLGYYPAIQPDGHQKFIKKQSRWD